MVLCSVVSASTRAATIYVSTAGAEIHDGRGWATAKNTVAAGLNMAAPGDQVWVAAGTYAERITLAKDVAVYGGFSGAETDLAQRNASANVTILDGLAGGAVVTTDQPNCTINGFTIRNGTGALLEHAVYWPNGMVIRVKYAVGGGIYCSGGSITIANNIITGNAVTTGATYGGGGAIFCTNAAVTISNNTIMGNTALSLKGGGILCMESPAATIHNNTIEGNAGTGIYVFMGSATIANNVIAANTSWGIDLNQCTASILSNTVTGNGTSQGGGISCFVSPATIANTIVAFNSAGVYNTWNFSPDQGPPLLLNNCVYGNMDGNYSGFADASGSQGNISADPKLAYPSRGNYHIQPGSPCFDSGDNSQVPSGWVDIDGQQRTIGVTVDMGADESDGTLWLMDWYRDADGDQYGNPTVVLPSLTQPAGYVADNTDCNDENSTIHPNATEICGSGVDEDCDGEDAACPTAWYQDADDDSYGNRAAMIQSLTPPAGYVADDTDCDDTNPAVHPGGAEICGNRIDEDCDGQDSPCPTLTVHVLGPGTLAGAWDSSGAEIAVAAGVPISLLPGTCLTLRAEGEPCSSFMGWSGSFESTAQEIQVVINGDMTLIAEFREGQTTVTPCGAVSCQTVIGTMLGFMLIRRKA